MVNLNKVWNIYIFTFYAEMPCNFKVIVYIMWLILSLGTYYPFVYQFFSTKAINCFVTINCLYLHHMHNQLYYAWLNGCQRSRNCQNKFQKVQQSSLRLKFKIFILSIIDNKDMQLWHSVTFVGSDPTLGNEWYNIYCLWYEHIA